MVQYKNTPTTPFPRYLTVVRLGIYPATKKLDLFRAHATPPKLNIRKNKCLCYVLFTGLLTDLGTGFTFDHANYFLCDGICILISEYM